MVLPGKKNANCYVLKQLRFDISLVRRYFLYVCAGS